MRVIVVDDEIPARDELVFLLKKYRDIDLVAEAEDIKGAMQACRRERPDVVFLDIHMPGGDGMKLARQLMLLKNAPLLVFATAYDRHAVEAFEVNAVDYLLKPFSEERVAEAVEKLRRMVGERNSADIIQHKIAVNEDGLIKLIDPGDIVYASRQGRNVIIKTTEKTYTMTHTLQYLENRLANYPFFRPHHSFLVNVDMIDKIEPWFNGYQIVMSDKDKSKVPVSRNGMKEIRRLFGI